MYWKLAIGAVLVLVVVYAVYSMKSLPSGISNGMVIRTPDGAIYKVEGGKKRGYTWPAYAFAGQPKFTSITVDVAKAIPDGAAMPEHA
jgi:hypothetical protein